MKLGVLAAHELADQAEPAEDLPLRWWTPFTCGRAGVLRVGDEKKPGRCGSRGCIDCHQRKLRRTMDAVEELRLAPGERMFSLVLAPPPVRSRADVAAFLGRVRGLFREWEQKHGLGAVWWVAEVVKKPDFERTCIPCPVRTYDPAAYGVGEWWSEELRGQVEATRAACQAGTACGICDGTGWLPGVHLHVHAALMARPFWFGKGDAPPPPPGAARWEDFGGLGWGGFLRKHGLGQAEGQGFGDVKPLRSKKGLAAYISKACLVYLAKSGDGSREVDHDASQLGAELAAAVYGRKRHREKGGRAYGLAARTRDAALRVAFEPGEVEGQRSPAELARAGERAAAVEAARAQRAVAEAMAGDDFDAPRAPVELLCLGRRNAARGDYGPTVARAAGAELRQARWSARAADERRRAEAHEDRARRLAASAVEAHLRWTESARRNRERADRSRSPEARLRYLARAARAGERAARLPAERAAKGRTARDKARAAHARAQLAEQRAAMYEAALRPRPGTHGVPRRTEVAEPRGTAKPGQVRSASGRATAPEAWQPEVTRWTEAGPRPAHRLDGPEAVAGRWDGVPFVGADDWWTAPHPDGVVVGRGAVCTWLAAEDWPDGQTPAASQLVAFARATRQAAELARDLDAYPDLAGCEPRDLYPLGEEQQWCEALHELAARGAAPTIRSLPWRV